MGGEEQQRQTMWGREHNLRDTYATGWWCPRTITRRGCYMPYAKKRMVEGVEVLCVCHHPAMLAVRDHQRTWLYSGKLVKARVLTTEPYGPPPGTVEPFRELMGTMGLVVYETGDSPWTAGTEVLVIAQPEVTREMLNL